MATDYFAHYWPKTSGDVPFSQHHAVHQAKSSFGAKGLMNFKGNSYQTMFHIEDGYLQMLIKPSQVTLLLKFINRLDL
jgi:hypothetical protein